MQASSPKAATAPRQPRSTDIDRHVGLRIRERRLLLGLNQTKLAELIGVTYQQAHKYENGVDRISASRLHQIAGVLGVEVSYFFPKQNQTPAVVLPSHQRMVLDLSRNFMAITDSRQKQLVCDLARSFAGGAPAKAEARDGSTPRETPQGITGIRLADGTELAVTAP